MAPTLNAAIDAYIAKAAIQFASIHEVDNLSMAVSLLASTRSVGLVPLYARNLLPPTVVGRPLAGEAPTLDLMIGYSKSNTSPLLKRFLSKVDELIERVSEQARA